MPHHVKNSRTNTKIHKNTLGYKGRFTALLVAGLLFLTGVSAPALARAQTLQQQIDALKRKNSQAQVQAQALDVEAGSYQEAIGTLQAQIDAVSAEIQANIQKRDQLAAQIVQKEAELAHHQQVMGKSIRAMYMEGEMSTIMMLATSSDLSEYLDKQQYRENIQDDIKRTMNEIKAIKVLLAEQKLAQEQLIAEQHVMQQQLAGQRAEQSRLLGLNQAQQKAVDTQMQANNGRIAQLRKQQAEENARMLRRSGGRVISNIPDSTGYPWANVQPFPNSYPDPWGMYKRQCVSYTAWKVHKDGKRMPYWGGRGNAKNWANNARREGIPVYSTPQRGDIAVSTRGTYGHVMYVEQVLGGGKMRISQYNAGWDGKYSEAIISTAGLEYVRFR